MPKEVVFTVMLEPELHAEFMSAAQASQRPAAQILRELMREFVRSQHDARQYDDFLRAKVTDAREQIRAGEYASSESVEFRAAEGRAQLLHTAQLWPPRRR